MTKQRLTIISLAGIVIFALLLSGKLLYENKWLNSSLIEESQQIEGVISAEIQDYQGTAEMLVNTSQVADLQKLSLELKNISGTYQMRIVDQRSAELEIVFDQMQFAIQEGIAVGNFTEMSNSLTAQAKEAGVDMDLTMDSGAIYLVLNNGENQLVSVIERHGQGVFLPSVGSDYITTGQ